MRKIMLYIVSKKNYYCNLLADSCMINVSANIPGTTTRLEITPIICS